MGTNYYAVKKRPTIREPLHIGKSSAGWKFLFQEVNKYNSFDWDLEIHTFEQMKRMKEEKNKMKKNKMKKEGKKRIIMKRKAKFII